METQEQGGAGKCGHHKVVSVLVILFGLTFLLGDWNVLTWGSVNVIWPILVILAGLAKMRHHGHCKMHGHA